MSELVYASAECESCVAKRAEIAKLKAERDVLMWRNPPK